jgi:hypothetical protein
VLAQGLQFGRSGRVVVQKSLGQTHCPYLDAAQKLRLLAIAQDQLGGATADIHHRVQPVVELHRREHPQVDAAGLFLPRDQLHPQAQLPFNPLQKLQPIGGLAHSTGSHGNNGMHLKALSNAAKPLQSRPGPFHSCRREGARLAAKLPQPDGGFFAGDDGEAGDTGIDAHHHHVERVAAHIDGRQNGGRPRFRTRSRAGFGNWGSRGDRAFREVGGRRDHGSGKGVNPFRILCTFPPCSGPSREVRFAVDSANRGID